MKFMKKLIMITMLATFSMTAFQACNDGDSSSSEVKNTDVVPSGTYTGTAYKVDPDEKEIYVKTNEGKTLELYFTDNTAVTQNGQTVSFDALKKDQNLEVTVEKKGNRLEPMTVKIMQ